MRIFLYGMQSSGATLFAFFLAQIPRSVAILDLMARQPVPIIDVAEPLIVKSTVATPGGIRLLDIDRQVFAPDVSILFLRDPLQIYLSLREKKYRDDGGTLEGKLREYEAVFTSALDRFDAAVAYEDLTADPQEVGRRMRSLGIPLPDNVHRFPRTVDEVLATTRAAHPWCEDLWGVRWSAGNLKSPGSGGLRPVHRSCNSFNDEQKVASLCPVLTGRYVRKKA